MAAEQIAKLQTNETYHRSIPAGYLPSSSQTKPIP